MWGISGLKVDFWFYSRIQLFHNRLIFFPSFLRHSEHVSVQLHLQFPALQMGHSRHSGPRYAHLLRAAGLIVFASFVLCLSLPVSIGFPTLSRTFSNPVL
jgi:hypothetical protein